MAKNLADLRFAVKSSSGDSSCIWRFWVTKKGDVYLAMRSLANVFKLSFHVSGDCRQAIVKEREKFINADSRLMFRWNRLKTPLKNNNSISKVAALAFPTDYLSKLSHNLTEDVFWIDAAPNGEALYLDVIFTYELQELVEQFANQSNMCLIKYTTLPSGEAVFLVSSHSAWGGQDLTVHGNHETSDLIFSKFDPNNTGRPIRIHLADPPVDGGFVTIRELGGYAAE